MLSGHGFLVVGQHVGFRVMGFWLLVKMLLFGSWMFGVWSTFYFLGDRIWFFAKLVPFWVMGLEFVVQNVAFSVYGRRGGGGGGG